MQHFLHRPALTEAKDLRTLVENRSVYSHDHFELNVFETHLKAEQVELQFNEFVLTSMFRGKKVMHLGQQQAFDYLPGESLILAPAEKMRIDFPEARDGNPTQCLAVEIGRDLIDETVNILNEQYRRPQACGSWNMDLRRQHLHNGEALTATLNRLVHLSVNDGDQAKDVLLNLAMKETIVRLMQTQARVLLTTQFSTEASRNPMAAVTEYIVQHLSAPIGMNKLARLAGMSRARFFQKFKEMYGETPARFISRLRIEQARKLLRSTDLPVAEIAYSCGFENVSHFNTAFKREVGETPGRWRRSVLV